MANSTPKITKAIQALWLEPYNHLTAKELLFLKNITTMNRDIDGIRKETGFSYKQSQDLIDKLQDILKNKYANL